MKPSPPPRWSKLEQNIFDDALADGADIETAGRRAGKPPLESYRHFHSICLKLGEPPR